MYLKRIFYGFVHATLVPCDQISSSTIGTTYVHLVGMKSLAHRSRPNRSPSSCQGLLPTTTLEVKHVPGTRLPPRRASSPPAVPMIHPPNTQPHWRREASQQVVAVPGDQKVSYRTRAVNDMRNVLSSPFLYLGVAMSAPPIFPCEYKPASGGSIFRASLYSPCT